MSEKLTPLLQAVAEHGGTELELKYNDFFTATFRARAQVTGQVGTKAESGAESKQVTGQVAGQVAGQVRSLLMAIKGEQSKKELMAALKLTGRDNFETRYLHPALEGEFIEMTNPEKPQSRLQEYRLTDKGRAMLRRMTTR
ncbi:Fic family protein [Desulfotignum balticum]|uniref:Fic family protein n=1 Tax=Desulfotignum balticum TaxID=115781 RepID=UPI0012EC2301|nr:hypothetical protein [Desulfotignum balticum]